MKNIVIGVTSGITAAAALSFGSPANAEPTSLDAWVKVVNQRIEDRMVTPASGRSGVVFATFSRGEDGRPTAVQISRTGRVLANAARRTLARIGALPPLPSGYEGKRIRMQMLVHDLNDTSGYYQRRGVMLASANAQNLAVAAETQGGAQQIAAVRSR
ncbi:hypothetical protein [Sphingomonas sp.]|jgi:hypothetical protein|uniref:hypothetical protein n=1 Tax=Sphingomonas sp. TaxID=28214 RepID=UPI00260D5AFA|nr:hypothetical protein [Sphingomonas sp.]MDF2496094.1 hypothetical protein [Sphingomonas sp.]